MMDVLHTAFFLSAPEAGVIPQSALADYKMKNSASRKDD